MCPVDFKSNHVTEPNNNEPCEPGTNVLLQGIVWTETESGVLVVNVTWRGKTYVGTLLDATKQEWTAPRSDCDSPTSNNQNNSVDNDVDSLKRTASGDNKQSKAKRQKNRDQQHQPSSPAMSTTESTTTETQSTNDIDEQQPHNKTTHSNSQQPTTTSATDENNVFQSPLVKKTKLKPSQDETIITSPNTDTDTEAKTSTINGCNPTHPTTFVPTYTQSSSKQCIVQSNGIVYPPVASEKDVKDLTMLSSMADVQQHKPLSMTTTTSMGIDKKHLKKAKKPFGIKHHHDDQHHNHVDGNERSHENGSPAYSDISDATNEAMNNELKSPKQRLLLPVNKSSHRQPSPGVTTHSTKKSPNKADNHHPSATNSSSQFENGLYSQHNQPQQHTSNQPRATQQSTSTQPLTSSMPLIPQHQQHTVANNGLNIDSHASSSFASLFANAAQQLANSGANPDILQQYHDTIKSFSEMKQFNSTSNFDLVANANALLHK